MICSYCSQENTIYIEICSFCEAPLRGKRPKLNGFMYLELCERPFMVLTSFHTYDLLVLLKLVREKRVDSYNLMRTVYKSSDEVLVPDDVKYSAGSEYHLYTMRMKVIEGILVDRMGYKPKLIDEKALESLKEKIEKD